MNNVAAARIPALLYGIVLAVKFLLALCDWTAGMMAFHAPRWYDSVGQYLDRLYPIRLWISLPYVFLFGFWLYHFHRDLANLFPGYPISPWGAVGRALIPIYHYWGLWDTWETAQRSFDSIGISRPLLSIRTAMIVFYVVWIALPLAKLIPAVRDWVWLNLTNEFLDVAVYSIIFLAASTALKIARQEQAQWAEPSEMTN